MESNAFFLTTNMATMTSGANQQCLQPLFTSTSTCLLTTIQCTINVIVLCTYNVHVINIIIPRVRVGYEMVDSQRDAWDMSWL